ncbi:MAG TPA: S8 family serine peptidase [Steroidobacteraceae bacterium]|jgi:serine protease|nr:S8 family serine peptidase [Steroidobacteraceae bacterium]
MLVVLASRPAAAGPGGYSSPGEYNPVRAEPLSLGPEADRLLMGFRATAGNAVTETVTSRVHAVRRSVTLAGTSAADAATAAGRAGLAIVRSRQITPSMHVLYLPARLYGAEVEAALARLRAEPSVQFAVVDRRRYPLAVTPNDPLFAPNTSASGPASGQWYMNTPSSAAIVVEGNPTTDLSATDAVSAWGITTGSTGIVIADVDTGVRFDHPDLLRAGLGGRLLPGYDFVGQDYDPTTGSPLGTFLIANDGDGWDPDPSDPGDWVSTTDLQSPIFKNDTQAQSSWHGTRVVGVMGAIANNGIGIAGMTWGSWILPVRALGKGGGYDSDIIAGIQWAAGMSVVNPDGPPVPRNPYPADIINLSLGGGADACGGSNGAAYQSALQAVTALGVLVVISAGNANGPVELPANCSTVIPGVMAVAGLRNVGTKVGYSSFGSQVSLSAPAGNCVTSSGDCLRSIDTTTNLGSTTPGENSYTNEIDSNLGTSFSAPIVAGIAALMKSVNNNLTPAQLIQRMQAGANPFPAGAAGVPTCPATDPNSGECVCPNDGSQCGAGMVDALGAVQAARKPIAVIVLPTTVGAGSVIDASASVGACDTGAATPAALAIASFAWSATPSSIIAGGANTSKVTINPASGTLTLVVTDAAGNSDTETVTLTASSATTTAPSSSGGAAAACPAPLAISPLAPTVTASFAPATVGENAASMLTITLANGNGFALTQSSFQWTLPPGLAMVSTPAPATTCTGAAHALSSTATTVALSDANIAADGNCTITLPVESATAGSYSASIAAQSLVTAPAGGNAQAATASLTVSAPSGGGGAIDGWDLMMVAGVLLTVRGSAARKLRRGNSPRERR